MLALECLKQFLWLGLPTWVGKALARWALKKPLVDVHSLNTSLQPEKKRQLKENNLPCSPVTNDSVLYIIYNDPKHFMFLKSATSAGAAMVPSCGPFL